jgi:hypothetical protein
LGEAGAHFCEVAVLELWWLVCAMGFLLEV